MTFGKGCVPWNKGLKYDVVRRERMRGKIPWNKGLKGKAYRRYYPKGLKGGRLKGYHHTEETRRKCSESRRILFENGFEFHPTEKMRRSARKRMKEYRRDAEFNRKMLAACRGVTKPHKLLIELLKKHTKLKTKSDVKYKFGKKWGSIDEADEKKKIAIYVDGEYWHKYPKGRYWDRKCVMILRKDGWRVKRFWAKRIFNDKEYVVKELKKLEVSNASS